MPNEWNQVMVDLIRETEYSWPVKSKKYRSVTSDEVLGSNEFQQNTGERVEPMTRLRVSEY